MQSPTPFHIMAKPSGSKCNIRCKYCFYLEKESLYESARSTRMSDEVLECYIRDYINAQPTNLVSFAWQGGEPTNMGLDYFKKAVEIQKQYANGKTIENAFQTNGTLINDDWAAFFKENNFLVGVSIDGPKELHNEYRKTIGGHGTFDEVVRGIKFLQKHGVEFNTLTCLNRQTAKHPHEVYRFLKKLGSRFMQFIPIVEREANSESNDWGLTLSSPDYENNETSAVKLTDWSVQPEDLGKFYISVFNQWVRKDVGKYYIQMFDGALSKWLNVPGGICVHSETCGTAVALEHDGSLYACDHFVYPNYRLGNILNENMTDLVFSEQQQEFGNNKKDLLPKKCLDCDVLFACNGGCPKHRFVETGEEGKWLNYLCKGYKMFFKHIDPYMKIMAKLYSNQRSPAEIMHFLSTKDGKEFIQRNAY